MPEDNRRNKNVLGRFYNKLPKSFQYISSILYLRISGVKVNGFGRISALSSDKLKIRSRIKAGRGSIIGKRVTINADLTIEDDVYIDDKCYIMIGPVFIGRGTNFMYRSEIVGPVSIGRYCAIARNSVFQAQSHLMDRPSIQRRVYSNIFNNSLPSIEKGGIKIGNDVWIGTRATILPGVSIGDGAIVGSGSILTKDVEPYSIVAGNPAIHKKWRFPEVIRNQLLELEWWEWDSEKIRKNIRFFNTDLTKVDNLYELLEE